MWLFNQENTYGQMEEFMKGCGKMEVWKDRGL